MLQRKDICQPLIFQAIFTFTSYDRFIIFCKKFVGMLVVDYDQNHTYTVIPQALLT